MTNAVTVAQGASNNVTFRNKIINGAMVINQRNLGIVTNTLGTYTIDRWQANQTAAGKYTVQQSSTAPVGFQNSYLATSTSAYSVSSSDIFFFQQNIEGYNIADLSWGTANAKTVTLSAWVQSSLTGTFGGAIANATQDYCYPFTFSIPVANTWTQVSITITGATAGTWNITNGLGMQVIFGLGGGSGRSATAGTWTTSGVYTATGATSVVGTNGATFYITGVQLEAGTTASPFEYRQYGTELALCQRYYLKIKQNSTNSPQMLGIGGVTSTTNIVRWYFGLPVAMRSEPSLSITSAIGWDTNGTHGAVSVGSNYASNTFVNADLITSGLSASAGTVASIYFGSSSSTVEVNSEL